jgi:quinol-cytochrome oxidoreductase complex cytochrome b subunit
MSSSPQPIPQPQSNAAWWVLGILGIVLCALVFIGLNIASYVAHRTRLISSTQLLEISTPAGRIEIDTGSRYPAGLPVYPRL